MGTSWFTRREVVAAGGAGLAVAAGHGFRFHVVTDRPQATLFE